MRIPKPYLYEFLRWAISAQNCNTMPGATLVSTVLLRSRFESTLMCNLLCFNMYSAARVIYRA